MRVLLPLLLSACRADGADTSSATGGGEAAVYEVDCATAIDAGLTVPGLSGPVVYLAEECGPSSCRPAEAVRRDGDVLFVNCASGYDVEARVVVR